MKYRSFDSMENEKRHRIVGEDEPSSDVEPDDPDVTQSTNTTLNISQYIDGWYDDSMRVHFANWRTAITRSHSQPSLPEPAVSKGISEGATGKDLTRNNLLKRRPHPQREDPKAVSRTASPSHDVSETEE